jgi:hypothetical protein
MQNTACVSDVFAGPVIDALARGSIRAETKASDRPSQRLILMLSYHSRRSEWLGSAELESLTHRQAHAYRVRRNGQKPTPHYSLLV